MPRTAFLAALLTSFALPGAAAAQCALHAHHGAATPMAQDDSREIDRGDNTEDLLDVARREKKMAPKVFFDAYRKLEWLPGEAYKIDAKTIDVAYGTVTLGGGWVIPVKAKDVDPKLLEERGEDWLPERDYIMAVSYTHLTLPTNREV